MVNKDLFEGKWTEFKGFVKKQWGKLTDDDIAEINGQREELLGRLQSHYGYAKDKAEEELKKLERECEEKEHKLHK